MSWGSHEQLIEQMVKESPSLTRLTPIKDISGGSGASTFLVQPFWERSALDPAILKVGPAAIVDKDESGLEVAKLLYRGVDSVITQRTADGMRALLLKLVGGKHCRTTFEDYYLASATTPEQVGTAVDTLFRTMNVGTLNVDKDWNPLALYSFSNPVAQSRALREIGDGLPTMVRWWDRVREKTHDEPAERATCHGDLHRRNILVCEKDTYVIDFGEVKEGHAMRDFAKLERDILLFLYPTESRLSASAWPLFDKELELRSESPGTQNGSHAPHSLAIQKAGAAIQAIRLASQRLIGSDRNWQFQHCIALLAQMIFAASDERQRRPVRELALAYCHVIRKAIETRRPDLAYSDRECRQVHRKDALWRCSYAFLRLDQLRSGGWGKSLPPWFEALVEGDAGTIVRNPEMRINGGTDLTVYGFMSYLNFLARLGPPPANTVHPESFDEVAKKFWRNMQARIGPEGGVGAEQPGRTGTRINVRHTVFGLIGFLMYSRWTATIPADGIKRTSEYLIDNLKAWRKDTSHLFGCYCGLAKLRELLKMPAAMGAIQSADLLLQEVEKTQDDIAKWLREVQPDYSLKPFGTCLLPSASFPFRPYSDFWRMERSNILMYLPFLVTEDGKDFHAFIDTLVLSRSVECLRRIITEFETEPQGIFYHRDGDADRRNHCIDWGLGAELLALLRIPAIKRALPSSHRVSELLCDRLVETFDSYHQRPDVFKFTHGCSFAAYLHTVEDDIINAAAVRDLDYYVDKLTTTGVTENDLNDLCIDIAVKAFAGYDFNHELSGLSLRDYLIEGREFSRWLAFRSIRDLLVDKLEAGEHIAPDDRAWAHRVLEAQHATVAFFDGPGGIEYAKHYCKAENVIRTLVTRISDNLVLPSKTDKRALDVGCGPGQYAKVLEELGFEVELYDASQAMLQFAYDQMGRSGTPLPRSLSSLGRIGDEKFDLVFACAIMVHVPRLDADQVYRDFYKILRPGGALFVNFKIGDHTLIGVGGRYFEYYRDHGIPWRMLEKAGFDVHEVTLRWNHQSMYRDPKKIHWANFYCTKPVSGSERRFQV